jgi:hypothetical protein
MARAARSARHVGRAIVAICLVVAVAGPAAAVVIDRDTGYDPRDIEPQQGFQPPDISSTTRRLATVDGRRVVAIIVRFYEQAASRAEVRIDAAASPRVDHLMLIGSTGEPVCYVWAKGGRQDQVEGQVGWRRGRIACRVPSRLLDPDKAIRWKVRAEASDGGFEPDFAPDGRGWYS